MKLSSLTIPDESYFVMIEELKPYLMTFLVVAIGLYYSTRFYEFIKLIQDIPEIPNRCTLYRLLTLSDPIPPKVIQKYLDESPLGVVQYYRFCSKVVVIGDPVIATNVMRDIRGTCWLNRNNNINNFKHWKRFHVESADWTNSQGSESVRPFSNDVFHKAMIETSLKEFLDVLTQKSHEKFPVLDLETIFGQLTIDMICKYMFNYEIDAFDNSEFSTALQECLIFLTEPISITFAGTEHSKYLQYYPTTFTNRFRTADAFLLNFINLMTENLKTLSAQKKLKFGSGAKFLAGILASESTRSIDIKSDLYIFMLSSYHIIKHTMCKFIYALCLYPHFQTTAQIELDQSMELNSYSELSLNLQNILKESMRMFPVRPITEFLVVDSEFGYELRLKSLNSTTQSNIHLPSKALIQLPTVPLRYSVFVFGEDRYEFKPSRWSMNESLKTTTVNDLLLYPTPLTTTKALGIGGDDTVGSLLAKLEFDLVIPRALKKFSFRFFESVKNDDTAKLLSSGELENVLIIVSDRSRCYPASV